jgi:hypothetical protein
VSGRVRSRRVVVGGDCALRSRAAARYSTVARNGAWPEAAVATRRVCAACGEGGGCAGRRRLVARRAADRDHRSRRLDAARHRCGDCGPCARCATGAVGETCGRGRQPLWVCAVNARGEQKETPACTGVSSISLCSEAIDRCVLTQCMTLQSLLLQNRLPQNVRFQVSIRPVSTLALSFTRSPHVPFKASDDRFTV